MGWIIITTSGAAHAILMLLGSGDTSVWVHGEKIKCVLAPWCNNGAKILLFYQFYKSNGLIEYN